MYAYKVYTYEVYTRDFDVRKIPISPPRLAVLVGIPLYWVACGGVSWCLRMVPALSATILAASAPVSDLP